MLALDIQRLDARIASYQRLMEKKEAESKKASPEPKTASPSRARAIGVDYYRKQLVKMRTDKQTLEMDLEGLAPPDPAANYVTYEQVPVKKTLEDEPTIGKAVTAFRVKYPKLKPGAGRKAAKPALGGVKSTKPKRTKLKPALRR